MRVYIHTDVKKSTLVYGARCLQACLSCPSTCNSSHEDKCSLSRQKKQEESYIQNPDVFCLGINASFIFYCPEKTLQTRCVCTLHPAKNSRFYLETADKAKHEAGLCKTTNSSNHNTGESTIGSARETQTWLASGAACRTEDRRPANHFKQKNRHKQDRHGARRNHGVVRIDGLRHGRELGSRKPCAHVDRDPANDCRAGKIKGESTNREREGGGGRRM